MEYGKLTVYFDDPFWTGVFESVSDGKLFVCKIIFGAEPKDYEIFEYILKNYSNLKFSSGVADSGIRKFADNPKRRQRIAAKEMGRRGIGTKSQQALQLQREENKITRRAISREQKETENQRRFELKQEKRKAKRRGR